MTTEMPIGYVPYDMVKNDPSHPEKLDPEIVPLCDALNDAGFITTWSCAWHTSGEPIAGFIHDSDCEVEKFARFLMSFEKDGDSFSFIVTKTILRERHEWTLKLSLHNVFMDTCTADLEREVEAAVTTATKLIRQYSAMKKNPNFIK